MKSTQVAVSFADRSLNIDICRDGIASSRRLLYDLRRFQPFTARAQNPQMLDALELALTLYVADRIVRRPSQSWRRTFEVTFPVFPARLSFWQDATQLLEELFYRSTGDQLRLHMVERTSSEHHAYRQPPLALSDRLPPLVSLLSDGLDSFAGAVKSLAINNVDHTFVSIVTSNNRQRNLNRIISAFEKRFGPTRLNVMQMRTSLNVSQPIAPFGREKSQRFRTPLAVIAGLTAAAFTGAKSVEIYENSFGLINPPFPAVQLEHESSQALHPANLLLWKKVASLLLGGVELRYPNRFVTKAEMVAAIPHDMAHGISLTTSCDAPQRVPGKGLFDCGLCGSCILRRSAIELAGRKQHDRSYCQIPPNDDVDRLAVLRYHAQLLRKSLDSPDPWASICRLQPTLIPILECCENKERVEIRQATIDTLNRWSTDMLRVKEVRNVA